MLQELGRLREVTFRGAGEGTGKEPGSRPFRPLLLARFVVAQSEAGACGGLSRRQHSEILAKRGVSGLYTSTLFRYDERVFEKLGPALELGRSFVRPEYQRQYAPLLLLWKGIARLLATQRRFRCCSARSASATITARPRAK
jgi:hypothetical protein